MIGWLRNVHGLRRDPGIVFEKARSMFPNCRAVGARVSFPPPLPPTKVCRVYAIRCYFSPWLVSAEPAVELPVGLDSSGVPSMGQATGGRPASSGQALGLRGRFGGADPRRWLGLPFLSSFSALLAARFSALACLLGLSLLLGPLLTASRVLGVLVRLLLQAPSGTPGPQSWNRQHPNPAGSP